jgi:hypothetical protein
MLCRQGPAKSNAMKLIPNLPWFRIEIQHLNNHRPILCMCCLIPARFASAPYTNNRERDLPVQLSSLLPMTSLKGHPTQPRRNLRQPATARFHRPVSTIQPSRVGLIELDG